MGSQNARARSGIWNNLEYFRPIYHFFYKIIFIGFVVICSLEKLQIKICIKFCISNAASSCFQTYQLFQNILSLRGKKQ